MAITVNTNVLALNAQRNLNNTQQAFSKSLERLSSGYRINRAADDSAGLAISERFKAQIRSTSQAERNTLDGVSLIQTAEGSFNEVSGILIRLRELAVQSANGTLSSTDRDSIATESTALVNEIDRISTTTKFNGLALIGSTTGTSVTFTFQVGTGTSSADQIAVTVQQVKSTAFGTGAVDLTASATFSLTTASTAQAAITTLDTAIAFTNSVRSTLGAAQNRFEAAARNLAVQGENYSAANSRIRDVDVAEETANLTRNQILSQAGASVLAQANQAPSLALSLLGR
jgi:flagellin